MISLKEMFLLTTNQQ